MSGQSCALPEVLSATSGDLPAEQLLVDSFVEKTNGTIVARSYKVLPGLMQFGEGDLIVDDGDRLSVVEFKYIDTLSSGRTAKVRRTHKRKKVKEQALLYAAYTKLRHPDRVVQSVTCTNEGTIVVRNNISVEDARKRVLQSLYAVWQGKIPNVAIPALQELLTGTRGPVQFVTGPKYIYL